MGKKRERKNERADNKRLTSRLLDWWNFKTFQIKLFIPIHKGRGRRVEREEDLQLVVVKGGGGEKGRKERGK